MSQVFGIGDRTLRLRGRISQTTLDEPSRYMNEWLQSTPAPPVFVEMLDAEFIDSSGLSWLLVWHKRFAMAGGSMVIYAVPPAVMNVLRMMRLDQVLNIAADAESARQMAEGEKT